MTNRLARSLVILLLTLVYLCFGLLSASLGLALIVVQLMPGHGFTADIRSWIGFAPLCLGLLFLYAALYYGWLRQRRKPVEPD